MSTQSPRKAPREIKYPDSDGKPMSDNTLQFEWIVTIKCALEDLYRDNPDVFIAGDLLWYPVEGDNKTRQAPDALVAFGRPKGYRGSYMQWREGGIAPQVAFEVLSPKNTRPEMERKRLWYFDYGVEEYYEFDPDRMKLRGWIRRDEGVIEIVPMSGHVSPRLGIRFELGEDLTITGPDGRPFSTYVEISRQRDESERQAAQARQRAEQERGRAEQERGRAEQERGRAEQARQREEQARQREEQARQREEQERQRAEQERGRADQERERADRLAAKLRELGLNLEE